MCIQAKYQVVDPKKVGKTIRELRTKKGMTQAVLSGLAGMDASHLKDIEAGRHNPNLNSIFLLAEGLDITAAQLIDAIEQNISK